MVKYKRTAKVYLFSFILAFLLLNVMGCVDLVNTEKTENNSEGLKKEAVQLQMQIDKERELKTKDALISDEEKQKEFKRLEEKEKMESKLLEQSKEIEEKIKELQKKGN